VCARHCFCMTSITATLLWGLKRSVNAHRARAMSNAAFQRPRPTTVMTVREGHPPLPVGIIDLEWDEKEDPDAIPNLVGSATNGASANIVVRIWPDVLSTAHASFATGI
jgi:hypothetical protein